MAAAAFARLYTRSSFSKTLNYNTLVQSSRGLVGQRRYNTFFGSQHTTRKPYDKFSQFRIRYHASGSHHHYATNVIRDQKSTKMLYYLTGLVFAMVGCTYAAVPLYRRFCQATGYGGTVQRRETVEEKILRHAQDGTVTNREIVVQFNADVSDGMPWKFIPTQREVRVKPGESALAFYTAENLSSAPITGMSTYNVTPMKAAVYFNKIQCFCFEEQRLLPGEQIDMPVFFYIDPEFETDPRMDGINNIILSYTFFKIAEDKS
ncbi:cytochrome c oxidase assembly protein COX11, mitochondrial-like [Bidens hawaiensis]|uniref:cytochrome c oxidase assembly protein COX11, mitochondrial-like n=1 Tax=Bidens hawaiensis TaxID=980011 RepID=UPI00404B83D4